MPLHTVTKHGQTKAGKPVVYFDGKTGYKDMIFLGNTAPPPVGALIDTEMSSTTRQDGGQNWFLNKWGMAPKDAQPATYALPTATVAVPERFVSPPQLPTSPAPIPAPAGYTEPERMFVSNIVAAAVTAGHAKDPVDLLAWSAGALVALREMSTAANMNPIKDAQDDRAIPF